MIASFGDRATEALFHGDPRRPRTLPPEITKTALRKLDMLYAATTLQDLRSPPGNRLEALKGKLHGKYSIRINDQWRILFRWEDGEAHEVEIVDYH